MLFGPLDLFMLGVDMTLGTSSLSVSGMNIELLHWLFSIAVSETGEK